MDKGGSEHSPEVVGKDDVCKFGQWLYSLPAEEQKAKHFQTVKLLHAEFHKAAAEVLGLVLKGNKPEASKCMEYGGTYFSASGKLQLELNRWKQELSA